MPSRESHDGAYKLLFSHPLMVRELLEGFVQEDWVQRLDFATLERVNGHYVADRLQQRSDDVVWRVRMAGGDGWLYLYLLLEFQSRSDRWMALRLLNYVGLLWQDLVRSKQLAPGRRLPPVFPLVIYNGRPRWNAPKLLQPLVAAGMGGALSGYQPRFRYFLFDEGQVSPEQAERADNTVTGLLALEASRDLETLQREIARLRTRLAAPEHDSLRRAFTVWIHRVALRRMIPGQDVPITETLEETETMLAERVTEWTREWKRAGLEQGLEQGLERGRLEGERATVQRQLTRRFGPLPEAALAQLAAADTHVLGLWAERLLDAPSLDEVLSPTDP